MFDPNRVGAEANARLSRAVLATFERVRKLAADRAALEDLHQKCLPFLSPPEASLWSVEKHQFKMPDELAGALDTAPENLVWLQDKKEGSRAMDALVCAVVYILERQRMRRRPTVSAPSAKSRAGHAASARRSLCRD